MTNKSIIFLFVLFLNYQFCVSQNDTILKLFRTTYVGKDRKVSLQANIETVKDVVVKDADNNYHLKKGSFGIADSIGLEVNNLKQIIGITFLYNYDTAIVHETQYVHELKKYQKLIESSGKEYKYSTNTKSITITKWEDKVTRFELIEIVDKGKRTTYSVIFDNELYYKKLKGSINLNKYDSSIELLKILGLK
jgi:hypothetical protein